MFETKVYTSHQRRLYGWGWFAICFIIGLILISFGLISLKLFLLFIKSFSGAFCCPVPQTFLLLTRIYQHFNTTGSPKVVAHYAHIVPVSVPKNLWYNLNIMKTRYSGKSFKDYSTMKKSKLSLLEKRKIKREKKKNKV